MRVDGLGGSAPLTPVARRRRSKAGFADLVEPDGALAAEAAAAPGVAPAPGQPAAPAPLRDPLLQDREARRHGDAMLGALASLQAALLTGTEAAARDSLAALAATRPQAADPGLEQTLQAIAVRAAVELAKRG
jgi:hypothetical protein